MYTCILLGLKFCLKINNTELKFCVFSKKVYISIYIVTNKNNDYIRLFLDKFL